MISETMRRILAFPPDTKVEWKSHDSSIAQRTAIEESRREKANEKRAATNKQQTQQQQGSDRKPTTAT
jgi:translation initiation factor 4E